MMAVRNTSWIDHHRYQNYLNGLDTKAQTIVKTIVDHTRFITSLELVEMIKRSLARFHQLFERYYVFVPVGKIGSEHWLLTQIAPLMKGHLVSMIEGDNDDRWLDPTIPIVVIDDAIYSSVNMCCHIDNYRYQRLSPGVTNPWYCLVGVTSSTTNLQVVHEFGATVMADLDLESLQSGTLFGDDEYMYDIFGCETDNVLPVLFEHKIANNFGSYQFYHKIVATPPNRSAIDRITLDQVRSTLNGCL